MDMVETAVLDLLGITSLQNYLVFVGFRPIRNNITPKRPIRNNITPKPDIAESVRRNSFRLILNNIVPKLTLHNQKADYLNNGLQGRTLSAYICPYKTVLCVPLNNRTYHLLQE